MLLLAGLAATIGALVAHEPMWQVTSCEIGVYGEAGIDNSAECNASMLAHYGSGVLVVLALPVTLCVGPAAIPTRQVAWGVAAMLLVCCFVALTSSTMLSFYSYYAPVALIAVVLAALHGRLTRTRASVVLH